MLPDSYYEPADLQPTGRYVCKPGIINRLTSRPVLSRRNRNDTPQQTQQPASPENSPTMVTLNEFNRQIRILATTIAQALLPFPLARTALNEAIQKLRPLFPEPFLEPTS